MDPITLAFGGVFVVALIAAARTALNWVSDGLAAPFKPQKAEAPKTKKTPFQVMLEFLRALVVIAIVVVILVWPYTRHYVVDFGVFVMRALAALLTVIANFVEGTPTLPQ